MKKFCADSAVHVEGENRIAAVMQGCLLRGKIVKRFHATLLSQRIKMDQLSFSQYCTWYCTIVFSTVHVLYSMQQFYPRVRRVPHVLYSKQRFRKRPQEGILFCSDREGLLVKTSYVVHNFEQFADFNNVPPSFRRGRGAYNSQSRTSPIPAGMFRELKLSAKLPTCIVCLIIINVL